MTLSLVLESHLNVAVRRFYPQFTVIEGAHPNQETGGVGIAKVLMNIGLHIVQEDERGELVIWSLLSNELVAKLRAGREPTAILTKADKAPFGITP